MSILVLNALQAKKDRLTLLAAFATNKLSSRYFNRPVTAVTPTQAEVLAFEVAYNTPGNPLYHNGLRKEIIETMFPGQVVREHGDLVTFAKEIPVGAVIVPTAPLYGDAPESDDYVIGQPYIVVSVTTSSRGFIARGKNTAGKRLNDIAPIETRTDLIRPATDDEIYQVVVDLMELRGVDFVGSILDDLECAWGDLAS